MSWTFDEPKILGNYDGDTISVLFEVWPKVSVKASIRVMGVDCPEIRGKSEQEKCLAVRARDFVSKQLEKDVDIELKGYDKYGRALAIVTIDGVDLAKLLIDEHLGREYHGGKRESWE